MDGLAHGRQRRTVPALRATLPLWKSETRSDPGGPGATVTTLAGRGHETPDSCGSHLAFALIPILTPAVD